MAPTGWFGVEPDAASAGGRLMTGPPDEPAPPGAGVQVGDGDGDAECVLLGEANADGNGAASGEQLATCRPLSAEVTLPGAGVTPGTAAFAVFAVFGAGEGLGVDEVPPVTPAAPADVLLLPVLPVLPVLPAVVAEPVVAWEDWDCTCEEDPDDADEDTDEEGDADGEAVARFWSCVTTACAWAWRVGVSGR
jgi:hypothetical protein